MSSPVQSPPGKVYLVGAGPGDPGLITLRGKYLLEHAEVVIYDYLANPKLLGLWGGSSGASPLDYRWGTVRRLVLDVQEGLARAGA